MCLIEMGKATSTQDIKIISITRCYYGMVSNYFELHKAYSLWQYFEGI